MGIAYVTLCRMHKFTARGLVFTILSGALLALSLSAQNKPLPENGKRYPRLAIRNAFVRTAIAIGLVDVTCPKSWRHTFATLLQEANVDPMIRQVTASARAVSR